ncbi:MAG: hypothetical protein US68_C0012G0027 [Candidatus Shapirobacteria bacterium GW2011_GWE1_38_10]|uniref:Uncharacterized protein n=1 Tax=Candidatus Shapirobacteria bacterium GW2011_GWE1_38_10 TaxID=1618488 RepID=A0A0G0I530_9BACT|nr:MAG: hypothetical protein US46_C0011G0033 [Candidatus Shapirobacteria bacterium GW2011_GWF2_37_20]KKQ49632.1 MAG: hypothetical protein US68_C0012G0027 [Candidatus Shapirobacteria bacterium GW2011_GWE1_38_10]KKQ64610.1 MAG: hypothetical protein US85_C0006G0017 [Candidatus Shapirobacteria bacterium GW2011_GWF1_38_23]
MSYDIFLYRKDGNLKPVKKEEVEKRLYPEFRIFEFNLDESEDATYFWIYYSQDAQWSGFDFTYQKDEGCYWASCPYTVDKDELEYFKKEVRDVAILLDFKIKDPQISEEFFDPADYNPNDPRGMKAIKTIKEAMKPENMSKILGQKLVSAYPSEENSEDRKETERRRKLLGMPAESKYFIFYVILSKKPKTLENLYLSLENRGFFASKVEKGERLIDVIEREIKELIGGEKSKLIGIDEKYDFALDREGKSLPRTKLTFRANYFDVKAVKTKYPMEWKELGK